MPDGLDSYLDSFKKKPATKDTVARVLDDEFAKLGYGDNARLSILGDVGRENNWDRNTIFKGHFDPKNKAYNRGIISWQGNRQVNLQNFLKKEGVLGRGDDDELRAMARFMDSELQTPEFAPVRKKLLNAKNTYEASEALRQYIKYVPDAPYNTSDPNFRVKNNAVWANRAKRLGLGSRSLDRYLDQFKDSGQTTDALDGYLDQFKQSSIPEPAATIALQKDSAANPKVKSRTGVLLNKGDEPKPEEWEGFGRHQTPDGRTMMVHAESAAKNLKLKTPEDVQTFIDKNPKAIERMIGIVDPVENTGGGQPVVTAQVGGNEAASAVVTDGEKAQHQADVYREQFPQAEIGLTTTDDIATQRQADDQPDMPAAPEQVATDADFLAANEYLKSVGQPELTREQFNAAQKGNFQAQATEYQTKLELPPQQSQSRGQASVPRRTETQVTAPALTASQGGVARPTSEGLSLEIGLTDKPANQTYAEWVKGKTASGLAEKLGVSYNAARRAMAKFPTTVGNSKNTADEDYYAGLIQQGDESTLLQVGSNVIQEAKRQDAAEKEATTKLTASREKLLASNPNLDVSPEMLDVMAAQDAGLLGKNEADKKLLQARNDYIDWLVNNGYAEESAIKKAFGIKESTEPISAAEWAWKSNPVANLLGLGIENKSQIPQQIKSGITKDILEYGSLAEANKAYKKQQEQRKFSESSGLGFGQPTEALKTAARYIAQIPSTLLETGAILNDVNLVENAYRAVTGRESNIRPTLMNAAKSWREAVDADKVLGQNAAYRNDWIVNEGAEAFAQLGVQLVGGALTGGATLAFPLAEGATAQYREADDAGAGQATRLTVAAAGAALAVPDLLLKAKYLRGISKAGQFKFIESLTSRLYAKFAQQATPELAKEATELTVKAFVRSLAKNVPIGTLGEQQQERWEDVGNKALKKALYKPSVTWEDILVPTAAEKRGYWAAGLAGAGGGTVETTIQRMSDTELARGQEVLSEMLANRRIRETDFNRFVARLKREQRIRAKIAPYFAADAQIQSEANISPTPEIETQQDLSVTGEAQDVPVQPQTGDTKAARVDSAEDTPVMKGIGINEQGEMTFAGETERRLTERTEREKNLNLSPQTLRNEAKAQGISVADDAFNDIADDRDAMLVEYRKMQAKEVPVAPQEKGFEVVEKDIPSAAVPAVVPSADTKAEGVVKRKGFAKAAEQAAPQEPQAKPKTSPLEMATAKRSEPFYSRVTSVIKDKMPPRATPAQVTALLAKNSVKELDPEMQAVKVWLGEQGGTVSKADVLAFVEANKTAVSEVVKGGADNAVPNFTTEDHAELRQLLNNEDLLGFNTVDEARFAISSHPDWATRWDIENPRLIELGNQYQLAVQNRHADMTRFAQWQLPGEKENYREEFLTAPRGHLSSTGFKVTELTYDDGSTRYFSVTPNSRSAAFKTRAEAEARLEKDKETYSNVQQWYDGHGDYQDVLNPIARIRYNDRTTSDGDKMLFVEEIQQPSKDNVAKMPKVYQKYGEEMAIRKMLYRAVEGDYDYLGLTTGQQQADRYDLSKQVTQITVVNRTDARTGNRSKAVIVDLGAQPSMNLGVNNDGIIDNVNRPEYKPLLNKPLEDAVGKGVADQILNQNATELSGDDLKIGGEGLINRYDRKHVDYINKIMKPYGVQIEDKELPVIVPDRLDVVDAKGSVLFTTRYDSEAWNFAREHPGAKVIAANPSRPETVHAVRISPEFKAAVEASMREQGGAFPMFAKNEPTPEMVELKETLVAPNIEVARYTRTGSQVKFDNLNAWVVAMQAADQAFDGNHLSKGLTLYGDNLAAYQKALTDFHKEMVAKPNLYSQKAIDGLERFIKTVEDAAKTRRKGTVEFILTADAIVEENVHATDIQRMATEDILDSISPEYFKRVQESALFKNAKDFLQTYGYNVNNEAKAKMAVYEFATKLRAGNFEELGIDRVKDKEAIIDGVADWIKNFKEVNGDLTGAEYEEISKTTAFLYQAAKARLAEQSRQDSETGRQVDEDRQVSDDGKGEKGSDLAGDQQGKDSGVEFEPSGKVKLSQTPISARGKANIPLKDDPYVSTSNPEQQAFADNQLAKGLDKATDWFNEQVKDGNLNNGATAVVGLNLLNKYGQEGNLEAMDKVAEKLVPFVREAAQTTQAMRILSKFDPDRALAYAALTKHKKTGQPLTGQEERKLVKLIEKLAKAETDLSVLQTVTEDIQQSLADAEAEITRLDQALKDAETKHEVDLEELKKNITKERPKKQTPLETLKKKQPELEAYVRSQFSSVSLMQMAVKSDMKPELYQALIDLMTTDILEYKSPEETFEHIDLLTNQGLSEEQKHEIQLEAWRATQGKREPSTQTRERIQIRLAHKRLAAQTRGKKAGVPKINRFDSEIISYGQQNGYTDAEIAGAVLMPKIVGGEAQQQWLDRMKGSYPDVSNQTFKRSYELRKKVLGDIAQQKAEADARKKGFTSASRQYEVAMKHARIASRHAKGNLDHAYQGLTRTWPQKIGHGVVEGISLFKGLSAWGEISYIMRQGFVPLLTDTKAAVTGDWKGVGHGLQGDNEFWKWALGKGGFNEAVSYLSNHSLSMFIDGVRQHPRFYDAQNSGVRFTQIGDFNIADDHFSTKLLEGVPLYRRAEVAYTLPGDLQRLYMFDNMAKHIEDMGLSKEEEVKAKKYAAETANAFTGKGDIARVLARGGALSKLANVTFFSPQLLISRFQSAYRLTTGFATAPKGMKFEMAKRGLRFYGILGLLGYMLGAVLDPDDDDFGRIDVKPDSWLAKQIPDTKDMRFDMTAGMDLPLQLAFRTAGGIIKAIQQGDRAYLNDALLKNWRDVAISKQGEPRFARGKLSPGMSFAVDAYTGKDFIGRPFSLWGGTTSRVLPLAWQQTYDALVYDREQAMLKEPQTKDAALAKFNNPKKWDNAAIMMIATFLGVGAVQYPKAQSSKALQLAQTLSDATSKKTDEERRVEGGLRNLFKAQVDAMQRGESTAKINREIQSYVQKYPTLNKQTGKILGQARSKTGLLAYYISDMELDELKRVRQAATDLDEINVLDKAILGMERKASSKTEAPKRPERPTPPTPPARPNR